MAASDDADWVRNAKRFPRIKELYCSRCQKSRPFVRQGSTYVCPMKGCGKTLHVKELET